MTPGKRTAATLIAAFTGGWVGALAISMATGDGVSWALAVISTLWLGLAWAMVVWIAWPPRRRRD